MKTMQLHLTPKKTNIVELIFRDKDICKLIYNMQM